MTEQEYLTQEREAEVRHEYWFGTVVAMSGGTRTHSVISGNLIGELHQALKRRDCEVYSSDMRLRVSSAGLYVYPDVMVVCGKPVLADSRNDVLLNPTLIVEVLSPSTEKYDMAEKAWHYRNLESVRDYVIVAQQRPKIEVSIAIRTGSGSSPLQKESTPACGLKAWILKSPWRTFTPGLNSNRKHGWYSDVREYNGVAIMAAQPNSILSEQEYLAQEREAEVRHEYWFGTVVAMSGGSERHPLITLNVAGELRHALKRRGCRVYSSDMRLRVTPAGLYVYPDIMAVCVEPAFADARNDTLLNPTVIVEVLSPSTEKYDMGAKGWHYRTLESVRDYVTVAQDSPRIEICHRTSSREWVISITEGIDATLRIESLNVEIPLAEIYANVTFE